jgi:protein-disulfide isomerase
VTLVEYGDLECPFCGQAYSILNAIEDEMGPQLCFVFRHFPIASIHPHAQAAALAAEAAGAQGRFWEMHDLLYEHQRALEDEDLLDYAQDLGLEMRDFEATLRSAATLARVKEDFMGGVHSGVNGTPTFFINGRRHDDSYEHDVLLHALKDAAGAKAAH